MQARFLWDAARPHQHTTARALYCTTMRAALELAATRPGLWPYDLTARDSLVHPWWRRARVVRGRPRGGRRALAATITSHGLPPMLIALYLWRTACLLAQAAAAPAQPSSSCIYGGQPACLHRRQQHLSTCLALVGATMYGLGCHRCTLCTNDGACHDRDVHGLHHSAAVLSTD
jgi:hypothetical protein